MISGFNPSSGAPNGKHANGKPRAELASYFAAGRNARRAALSFDAARDGTDLDGHWSHADAFDADTSYSRSVRHKLIHRSRYESGSNGYYAGIVRTHVNMLVGVGPTLRMLSGSRDFNQLAEKEFYAWAQQIQLRRKLWAMAHARTRDGECFGILINNEGLRGNSQLDLLLIEAEQCQTAYLPVSETGYVDGIRFDPNTHQPLWYDILPEHPGSSTQFSGLDPVPTPASSVLHWFRLERPGAHRGVPDMTSTLSCGAMARRHREATVAAAESAADIGLLLTTNMTPNNEADPVAPLSTSEWQRRMIVAAPMGWAGNQVKGEHPNAQYGEFHRNNISELGSPITQPYNVAAHDSSTYSFASGKLDTLCYRAALDVERQDCNELVLDRLFAAWFREWTILTDRRDIPPLHQWDWPRHPAIDVVQEETAIDMQLKNGTSTMRQVFSDKGMDLEDQVTVMAEDMFGEANEETIAKARQILVLKNTSKDALPYVAQMLGLSPVTPPASSVPQGQPA